MHTAAPLYAIPRDSAAVSPVTPLGAKRRIEHFLDWAGEEWR